MKKIHYYLICLWLYILFTGPCLGMAVNRSAMEESYDAGYRQAIIDLAKERQAAPQVYEAPAPVSAPVAKTEPYENESQEAVENPEDWVALVGQIASTIPGGQVYGIALTGIAGLLGIFRERRKRTTAELIRDLSLKVDDTMYDTIHASKGQPAADAYEARKREVAEELAPTLKILNEFLAAQKRQETPIKKPIDL